MNNCFPKKVGGNTNHNVTSNSCAYEGNHNLNSIGTKFNEKFGKFSYKINILFIF